MNEPALPAIVPDVVAPSPQLIEAVKDAVVLVMSLSVKLATVPLKAVCSVADRLLAVATNVLLTFAELVTVAVAVPGASSLSVTPTEKLPELT